MLILKLQRCPRHAVQVARRGSSPTHRRLLLATFPSARRTACSFASSFSTPRGMVLLLFYNIAFYYIFIQVRCQLRKDATTNKRVAKMLHRIVQEAMPSSSSSSSSSSSEGEDEKPIKVGKMKNNTQTPWFVLMHVYYP